MARFSRFALLVAGLAATGCGRDRAVDGDQSRRSLAGAREGRFGEQESSPDPEPVRRDPSPVLAEQVSDGSRVDPFADPDVKAVVLLFVSTDCPIANRYVPTIAELYERYRSKPVEFWLVYADPSETREMIQAHLAEYKHRAQALRDPKHHLVAFCRATKTPEAVVFAPGRKLAYRGRIDDLFTDFGKRRERPTRHDLRDAIDAVLAGREVDSAWGPAIGCDIPGATP